MPTAGLSMGAMSFPASSYGRIIGGNARVNIGIVGFSDRAKGALIPAMLGHAKECNFEFTAVSDIWNRRRDEGVAYLKDLTGRKIKTARNNEELYERKDVDAVIISSADFQHALHCKEAVEAGRDAYVEKPFAETMEDNKAAREAVERTGKIVQVGSQRRSGSNYHAANDFIRSGKFGDIVMVEMSGGKEELNFKFAAGESVTFKHRVLIYSGNDVSDEQLNEDFEQFSTQLNSPL